MKKILLIEDNILLSRMYQRLFVRRGYVVEVCDSAESGIDLVKKFSPDLILLDIMLSGMNGLEFLDEIKSDPDNHTIHVVLLTNLGLMEELDKALERGASKYIIKNDHHPNYVFETVQSLLESKNKAN